MTKRRQREGLIINPLSENDIRQSDRAVPSRTLLVDERREERIARQGLLTGYVCTSMPCKVWTNLAQLATETGGSVPTSQVMRRFRKDGQNKDLGLTITEVGTYETWCENAQGDSSVWYGVFIPTTQDRSARERTKYIGRVKWLADLASVVGTAMLEGHNHASVARNILVFQRYLSDSFKSNWKKELSNV